MSQEMHSSHTNLRFSIKIEENPAGGFIARSAEPPFEIEAATREELDAKVREKLIEVLGPKVAELLKNVPILGKQVEELVHAAQESHGVHAVTNTRFNFTINHRAPDSGPQMVGSDSPSLPGAPTTEGGAAGLVKLLLLLGAALVAFLIYTRLR